MQELVGFHSDATQELVGCHCDVMHEFVGCHGDVMQELVGLLLTLETGMQYWRKNSTNIAVHLESTTLTFRASQPQHQL